ncbi:hypothetical protein SUGI_0094130 [Cryptomeria japonica]|nr:hypothetical protein SUGI_0094130 [Cryptomeria japonica]
MIISAECMGLYAVQKNFWQLAVAKYNLYNRFFCEGLSGIKYKDIPDPEFCTNLLISMKYEFSVHIVSLQINIAMLLLTGETFLHSVSKDATFVRCKGIFLCRS